MSSRFRVGLFALFHERVRLFVFRMGPISFILKCDSLEILNNDSNEDYEGK
jgi:hypothetical protein